MIQILPAVDVLGGNVVRLERGDYDAATIYGTDPAAQLRSWSEQGAALVHVVDLDGARSGEPSFGLWEGLGACGVTFQAGGGLRTVDDAVRAAELGAARVVLGSAAVWDPDVLAELVDRLGPDRVVAALDVRDGMAQGAGWLDAGKPVGDVAASVAERGVRWCLVTGIERDGMLSGPNTDVIEVVKESAPDLQLIVSGGVGSLDDLQALNRLGYPQVIVGRALYEKVFTLQDALAL
ncbi:MAG: 1-(5-phosphoribosyl)-5-[(5-phosphoribosylamino)methylideneamino] imidazole-4-carboxamide isomerase [Acidobacteria bacterium]|nr:1-(5-phosphoribosyl)-5-[(5-phosphoribosylamino)methylideneamino] imidazole-4-carboxamide isomerase [Acidobacteriota bacterium]